MTQCEPGDPPIPLLQTHTIHVLSEEKHFPALLHLPASKRRVSRLSQAIPVKPLKASCISFLERDARPAEQEIVVLFEQEHEK